MSESDLKNFETSLKKDQWLTMYQTSGTELKIKSSEIKCYEVLESSVGLATNKGEMTLVRLAEIIGVHPVSVSRLASSGKIPVITTKGTRRKHSRATIETALALRENMIKLGRSVPSVEKLKEYFK